MQVFIEPFNFSFLVRGIPASLKSPVIAFLCRPGKTMGDTTSEFSGVDRIMSARGHVAALNYRRYWDKALLDLYNREKVQI